MERRLRHKGTAKASVAVSGLAIEVTFAPYLAAPVRLSELARHPAIGVASGPGPERIRSPGVPPPGYEKHAPTRPRPCAGADGYGLQKWNCGCVECVL